MSDNTTYQSPIIEKPSRFMNDIEQIMEMGMRLPFRVASMTMGVSTKFARQSFKTFQNLLTDFNNYSCNLCQTSDCSCKCSGFDFSFETRIGEVKILNVLLENNTKKNQIVKISSSCLMDCNGKQLNADGIIGFSANEINLAPHQQVDLKVIFKINKPLDDGASYIGNINIERNCKIKQVCFCLNVLSDCDYDQHWLTDDCADPIGEYYESCCCHHEQKRPESHCNRYYVSN